MLRILTAAMVALAASACTIGLPSAVDAAPLEARLAGPPVPDGVYCGLDDDEDGQLLVRSFEEEGGNNCAALSWDAPRRLFVMSDEGDEAKQPGELVLADLGDGLLLLQFDQWKDDDASSELWSFLLMAGVVHGEAIGILPLIADDNVLELAARYPGLALSRYRVPFMTPSLPHDAPEGAEPPESPHHYISSGSPEDIRSLARDLALRMLRNAAANAEEAGIPLEGRIFVPAIVRDQAGLPDHPLSAGQQRDIDAILAKLLALKDS